MITKINPNINFDYYELNNYIDNMLVYIVNKTFTMNIKTISIAPLKLDDETKFWLRKLVISESMSPSKDIRFKITNNLINSFKKAHND